MIQPKGEVEKFLRVKPGVGFRLTSTPAVDSIRQAPRYGMRLCDQHGAQQQCGTRVNLPEDQDLRNYIQNYGNGY